MLDAERWAALTSGSDCSLCERNRNPGPDSDVLVAELPSGRVLLQPDGDFPGYCILVYRRHVTELFDLSDSEQVQLVRDVATMARAVQAVCRPVKLNYAILGNEAPHLHCHVIPRYPDDGWWGKAIWLRPPGERRALDAGRFAQLRRDLSEALGR